MEDYFIQRTNLAPFLYNEVNADAFFHSPVWTESSFSHIHHPNLSLEEVNTILKSPTEEQIWILTNIYNDVWKLLFLLLAFSPCCS